MSALSTDRKPPLDYGVQIRFIKDLHDTGGGYPEKTRGVSRATLPSNKYGVAVRVQGISGQPYVVLKDGEKGDSYGVQLKTQQDQPQNPNSGLSSPYNSLPQRKERGDDQSPYALTEQTLSSLASPVSTPEDEGGEDFGSPFKRPPGDGQAGSQGEGEGGPPIEGQAERVSIKVKEEPLPTAAEPYRVVMKERGCVKWEEFNEAGLKPVSPRGAKQNGVDPGGSLGRNDLDSSFPEPLLPMSFNEEPVPAIDKTSLAPINKLISKFNIGTPNGQTRGRSGARLRLKFDERRRSRSLDARKEEVCSEVSPSSPTPNPYASSPLFSSSSTSSTPPYISLGWSPASVAKVTALPGPKPSFIKSPGKFVVKDTPPAIPPKKARMPAPLRDHRGQSLEVISGEDPQTKQAVYTILKEGTSESDVSVKRKDNLVYEKSSGAEGRPKPVSHGNLKEELEQSLKENLQLQEQFDLNKTELQQAQEELIQLRMAREGVESRVRQQEDLLAELQEELRGISENTPQTDSDVMSLQADLAEASMLRQRQEEVLRQRERELTALKGALKEEVGSHDQEMESLREQYSLDMETLRSTMEQVSQSQQQIEEERQRVNDSMLCLEEELESCRDQGGQWREQLETATEELHSTKQELMRARLEKEAFEGELKALQDSLMSMKKRMPGFDKTDSSTEDLLHCHDDIKQARTELDKQKVELNEKEELQALRRASQARESELRSEIDRLKDQSRQEKDELEMALEKAKQSSGGSSPLDQGSLELLEANTRLRERLARMTRLHFSVPQSSGAEKALEDENHSLRSQLEEARRGASRLGKERDELGQRLEERDLERDALRRGKSDLEEQKRLLDRALEKISKEMEVMLGDSRQSVQTLQSQLDEYRERSRRDLQDAQRQGKDRLAELQRAQANLKTLQEEVSRLKKELVVCGEERDSSQLERDLLCSRLKHLESELDSERSSQMDRNRELRGLEDKAKTMEIELDEEKNSVELLNDRVARSREQIDQLRGDLMKERSTVHDLEMDKSVLERQVKELRSRVADMETQSRPSAGITLLEGKVQELEERLHSEEREKLSIQSSQRRVERKLKDIIVTLDQERNQHAEQRDQLSLRVKALKRQLDESEGEVERLEGVRRKALRDLEEQQELQEALQAKVTALESEKRKVYQTRRPVLGSSNLSSEDEDSFYDNSITSFLTEGQLHTTNC